MLIDRSVAWFVRVLLLQ